MSNPESYSALVQIADTEQLTLSGTHAVSTTAPDGVSHARIFAVADAWIRVGDNATAAANTALRMTAGQVECFRARKGMRVSAIQFGSGGTVDVTWMA